MINPLAAALVSGVLMYQLGSRNTDSSRTNDKTAKNNQENLASQIQIPKLPTHEETKQKYKAKTDSFAIESIQSIVRSYYLNPACIVHYSTLHRAPLAVHQKITKEMILGNAPRSDSFFVDPTLSKNQDDKKFLVDDSYYKQTSAWYKFNFHRGHMGAAGNYDFNFNYKKSTFSFANTVPQDGDNNTGIWNTFERYARSLLSQNKCDSLEIVSGPIYHQNGPHPEKNVYENKTLILKEDGIMVPPMLYKIIKCNTSSSQYISGFMFPNSKTKDSNHDNNRKLIEFEVPLSKISVKSGLNFDLGSQSQSLSRIDEAGINKTKRDYDEPFYREITGSAKSIDKIQSGIQRAQKQMIQLCPQEYMEKIQSYAKQQFPQIDKSQASDCKKLAQKLALHYNLWYLKYPELSQKIEDSLNENIIKCRDTNDEDGIKDVRNNIFRNRRAHKYKKPYDSQIEKEILSWKKPETKRGN